MTRALLLFSTVLVAGCSAGGDVSNVAPAAAVRSACFGAPLAPELQRAAYLRSLEGADPRAFYGRDLSCAAGAGSCPAYLECLDVEAGRACPSEDVPASGRCLDDVTVERCFEGMVRTVACGDDPHGNGRCFLGAGREALCRAGPCDAVGSRCDGDVAVACDGALEQRTDCSLIGATCAVGAAGAACVHEVEACTEDRCGDDTTFFECVEGAGSLRHDCTLAFEGGRCGQVDLMPRCVPPLPECPDGEIECDGDEARVCVGGEWLGVSCAEAVPGASCAIESTALGRTLLCSSD
ncbi:MAG TPA: hypothetical protein RMH99_21535 [Sandaracinaceae bacterium LLY-WYZ-13_1]|nr:hypothetical protein [Sandaracinaceae bacterium LLY-WYZ-13_1]